jgi:L-arabinose isomerase
LAVSTQRGIKPLPSGAIDYVFFTTNNRGRLPIGARAFVNHWNSHGLAHNCAIGFSHIARKLTRFAARLGIHIEKIC